MVSDDYEDSNYYHLLRKIMASSSRKLLFSLLALPLALSLAACTPDAEPEESPTASTPVIVEVGDKLQISEKVPSELTEEERAEGYDLLANLPTFTLSEDNTVLTYRNAGSESCPPIIEDATFFQDRDFQIQAKIGSQVGDNCELDVAPFQQELTREGNEPFPEDVTFTTVSELSGTQDA